MTSTPPAGWYNDPSGAVGTLRYWDGAIWTGHTHTVAAPSPAPPLWQGPPLVNYGRRLGGWLIDWILVSVVSSAVIAVTHSYRHPSTTYLRNGVTVHSWNISIGWKGILIDAALAIA